MPIIFLGADTTAAEATLAGFAGYIRAWAPRLSKSLKQAASIGVGSEVIKKFESEAKALAQSHAQMTAQIKNRTTVLKAAFNSTVAEAGRLAKQATNATAGLGKQLDASTISGSRFGENLKLSMIDVKYAAKNAESQLKNVQIAIEKGGKLPVLKQSRAMQKLFAPTDMQKIFKQLSAVSPQVAMLKTLEKQVASTTQAAGAHWKRYRSAVGAAQAALAEMPGTLAKISVHKFKESTAPVWLEVSDAVKKLKGSMAGTTNEAIKLINEMSKLSNKNAQLIKPETIEKLKDYRNRLKEQAAEMVILHPESQKLANAFGLMGKQIGYYADKMDRAKTKQQEYQNTLGKLKSSEIELSSAMVATQGALSKVDNVYTKSNATLKTSIPIIQKTITELSKVDIPNEKIKILYATLQKQGSSLIKLRDEILKNKDAYGKWGQEVLKIIDKTKVAGNAVVTFRNKVSEAVRAETRYRNELERANFENAKYIHTMKTMENALGKVIERQKKFNETLKQAKNLRGLMKMLPTARGPKDTAAITGKMGGMGIAGKAVAGLTKRFPRLATFAGKALGVMGKIGGVFKALGPYGAIAAAAIKGVGKALGMAYRFGKFFLMLPFKIIRQVRQWFVRWYVTVLMLGFAIMRLTRDVFEFQKAVIRTAALAGKGWEEYNNILMTTLRLMIKFPVTSQEIAQGMQKIAQAGFRGADITKILTPATHLATIFGGAMPDALDVTIAVMKTFELGADEAAGAVGMLYNVAANTNITIKGLSTAMGYAGAAAKALGVSLADMVTLVGAFRDSGATASRVGTILRAGFTRLAQVMAKVDNETMSATEALAALNVDGKALAETEGDLVKMHKLFHEGMKGVSKETKRLAFITLFGRRAYAQWAVLMEKSTEEIVRRKKQIEKLVNLEERAAKVADRGANIIDRLRGVWLAFRTQALETMEPVFEKVSKYLEDIGEVGLKLGTVLGTSLLPAVGKVADAFIKFVSGGGLESTLGAVINDFIKPMVGWIQIIIGYLGTWVGKFAEVGEGTSVLRTMTDLMGKALYLVVVYATSFADLVARIIKEGELGKILDVSWKVAKSFFEIAKTVLSYAIPAFKALVSWIKPIVQWTISVVKVILSVMIPMWKVLVVLLKPVIDTFIEIYKSIASLIAILQAPLLVPIWAVITVVGGALWVAFSALAWILKQVNWVLGLFIKGLGYIASAIGATNIGRNMRKFGDQMMGAAKDAENLTDKLKNLQKEMNVEDKIISSKKQISMDHKMEVEMLWTDEGVDKMATDIVTGLKVEREVMYAKMLAAAQKTWEENMGKDAAEIEAVGMGE